MFSISTSTTPENFMLYEKVLLVMQFGNKQHFARPSTQYFLQNTLVLTTVTYNSLNFLYSCFCKENLHKWSSYLYASLLKIWSKSNEILWSYVHSGHNYDTM